MAFALSSPILLLALGVLWFHHGLHEMLKPETIPPDLFPPVPEEVVIPLRHDACLGIVAVAATALVSAIVAGRGRRDVIVGTALGLLLPLFFAFFTALFAIAGDWP